MSEYVSNFSVFLFIPFIATSPLETTTSEHSLHSLRIGAGKGKWRQAGLVSSRLELGERFNKLLIRRVEQYIRCHVEGGKVFLGVGLSVKTATKHWRQTGESKMQAATKRNSIRDLRTRLWTEEGARKKTKKQTQNASCPRDIFSLVKRKG